MLLSAWRLYSICILRHLVSSGICFMRPGTARNGGLFVFDRELGSFAILC